MENETKKNNAINATEGAKKAPAKKKKTKKKPSENMSWSEVTGDFKAATKAQKTAAEHEAAMQAKKAEKARKAKEAREAKKAAEAAAALEAAAAAELAETPSDQLKPEDQAVEAAEVPTAEAGSTAAETVETQASEVGKKGKKAKKNRKSKKAESIAAATANAAAAEPVPEPSPEAVETTVEAAPDEAPAAEIIESPEAASKPKKGKGALKAFIALLVIAGLATAGWFGKDLVIPKTVNVAFETMEGGSEITQEVRAKSVGEALEKLGIYISDLDTVTPSAATELVSGMTVNVLKRLETSAKIAGKAKRFILSPGTIEENLAFNKVTYDDNDIIKPKLSKKIKCNTNVVVKDVKVVVKKKKITVKSTGYRVILDPSLASGVMSESAAVDGVALYKYTYKYVNGKKKSTKKKFKKWITEPQDRLLRLGTASTGNSGTVSILRTFTSNTTAYYAGKNGRGALGTRCHYGTCAVDPKVFPYGSAFWVQGYGYCVANDCGGAIKGTKLDLYMTSTKQCYRWGRRWVTAYLLGSG
ncbi:MAG: DUF348 domain-containing protein [Firmicutes bacterium]|nr:DUF348 domain-containing protein [Bacillota bacterium]